MREPASFGRPAAESIAIQALAFLAEDAERLVRFLDISGLDPGSIRSAARNPGFLAGVMEYVAGDESLLLAFAAAAGLDPSEVARAAAALSGDGTGRT